MSHKCEHGKDSDVCVLCATDYDAAQPDPRKPERPFVCPACGSTHFGRETGQDTDGKIVVLDTVRCHGDDCEWRGKWPPLPGRPPIAGETATGHIHIRSTMARKNAYVRAAKPKSLAAWATEILDKASGYGL